MSGQIKEISSFDASHTNLTKWVSSSLKRLRDSRIRLLISCLSPSSYGSCSSWHTMAFLSWTRTNLNSSSQLYSRKSIKIKGISRDLHRSGTVTLTMHEHKAGLRNDVLQEELVHYVAKMMAHGSQRPQTHEHFQERGFLILFPPVIDAVDQRKG